MREVFKPTAVQKKALKLLSSSAKHVLLFGGSRSGKTTVLVMAIIFRILEADTLFVVTELKMPEVLFCMRLCFRGLTRRLERTITKPMYTTV